MTYLKGWFLELNCKYFRNSLPKDCVVKWADLRPIKAVGCFSPEGLDTGKKVYNKPTIEIDNRFKSMKRLAIQTLIHEMVHLKLDGRKGFIHKGHGHLFQREMKKLAKIGAFNRLW